MTGKYPFVLGRLAIEVNHIPLLENNVVLTLHYLKNNGKLTQWQGQPSGFYLLRGTEDKVSNCLGHMLWYLLTSTQGK